MRCLCLRFFSKATVSVEFFVHGVDHAERWTHSKVWLWDGETNIYTYADSLWNCVTPHSKKRSSQCTLLICFVTLLMKQCWFYRLFVANQFIFENSCCGRSCAWLSIKSSINALDLTEHATVSRLSLHTSVQNHNWETACRFSSNHSWRNSCNKPHARLNSIENFDKICFLYVFIVFDRKGQCHNPGVIIYNSSDTYVRMSWILQCHNLVLWQCLSWPASQLAGFQPGYSQ